MEGLSRAFIMLVLMIFLHCIADYTLQGILASMKQKDWWKGQVPDHKKRMYEDDYKVALLTHSFEWAFTVTVPMLAMFWRRLNVQDPAYIKCFFIYLSELVLLISVHYQVDNDKANAKNINLKVDQTIHLIQIVVAWILWTLAVGW